MAPKLAPAQLRAGPRFPDVELVATMENKLGALVLGPGWVAGEHIKGYCQSPDTEIRAIVGMMPEDRDRAAAYMQQFGFQADCGEDYDAALARDDVDLVSICVINHLHHETAMKAIRAGKHVLVEKPLAFTGQQALEMAEAAEEAGVTTMVGHVVRFYPGVSNAHRYIDEAALGTIFYGEADYFHEVHGAWKARRETSGSTLHMGGCHAIDILRWFMGMDRRVCEVVAYGNGPFRRTDFEFLPNMTGILRFEDGGMGRIGCSLETSMPYVFHFQVMGTEGCIRNNQVFLTSWGEKKLGFRPIEGKLPDDYEVSHHPFPAEIQYFVNCIKSGEEPMGSIRESVHTYEIADAMNRSAESGGTPVCL